MTFHDPNLLWLLLVPVLIMAVNSRRSPRAIRFPAAGALQALGNSPRARLSRLLPLLRILSRWLPLLPLPARNC